MSFRIVVWVAAVSSILITVSAEPSAKFYPAKLGQNTTGNYIAVLKNSVNPPLNIVSFSQRVGSEFGLQPRRHFQIGNFSGIVVEGNETQIKKLLEESEIDYIEEEQYVYADDSVHATNVTNVTCYRYDVSLNEWGLIRIDSRSVMPTTCLYGYCNYTYSSDDNGQGVDVYVVDTGINLDHVEFGGRARWGYTASNIDEPEDDYVGHGTHVAGIAIGKIYGVAKGANAVAVKVFDMLGSSRTSGIIEGIEWAWNDIKSKGRRGVLNLSLGRIGRSYAIEDAITSALDDGIPFVVAAGNDAHDACLNSPAILGKDTDVITVGATNVNDELASFSNYGECVNILAPGEDIYSANTFNNSGVIKFNGTSMAAPFVSGIIARIMHKQPLYGNPRRIKEWVIQEATKGLIDLSDDAQLENTPNRMVNIDCGRTLTPAPPEYPDNAGRRGTQEVSIVMLTAVFATLMQISIM